MNRRTSVKDTALSGDPFFCNSPTDTVIDELPLSGQMSMTWRSIANGTRQPVPPSQSTVAVRWFMRVMGPTWGCRYLSVNEILSPRRKSSAHQRAGAGRRHR